MKHPQAFILHFLKSAVLTGHGGLCLCGPSTRKMKAEVSGYQDHHWLYRIFQSCINKQTKLYSCLLVTYNYPVSPNILEFLIPLCY